MERCDNRSVGVIIANANDEILLLSRARYPYGLAAPAGHIDDHGSSEQAAIDEVREETGLIVPPNSLVKIIGQRLVSNTCRRPGGDHHVWDVYQTPTFEGDMTASQSETLGANWYSPDALQLLADATRKLDREAQRGEQVLEPIWLDFFTELGIVK